MDSIAQTILITGGAGFIGSELVRNAKAAGFSVRIVDNLVNGKRENIEEILSDRMEFIEADIRDLKCMKRVLAGVDLVYHLACLGVRHSIHSPRENHDVNATATLDLLRLSREAGVKRFVYVSSSEIYGTAHQVPISEETPPFPHTVYGASKLAGDCYARAYWDTYRFPTTVVRPFNSYGPRCHHEGDSGEVIPKFMLRALAGRPLIIFGDGGQTRDFMYVGETAHWIMQAGLRGETIGETINLGFGSEISVAKLAKEVLRAVARPGGDIKHESPRPGDVLRLWADATKAKRLLKFSPRISLEEGLRKLLAWYRSRGCSPEELLTGEVVRNWIKEG
jgi:UDP-glucose 4-epimerase